MVGVDTARIAQLMPYRLDLEKMPGLVSLMSEDVRWGGDDETDEVCHGRDEVAAFLAQSLTA